MSKAATPEAVGTSKPKMYLIEIERDGETFTRETTILGIPLWIPQKTERNIPNEIVGDVVDLTLLPPNEEAGYKEARKAMILKTKTGSHWVVPISSPVLERQFKEQREPVVGDRVFVSFDGKAKKNKKPGFMPANLFTIAFIDVKKTEAAQKAVAASQNGAAVAQVS